MTTSTLSSHHLSAILPAAAAVYQWTEADFLSLLQSVVGQVGLTIVGELAFTFQPHGVSAIAMLAESHVALHFWPEKAKVTVDIHVCDFEQGNQVKAEQLAQLLSLQITGESCVEHWHCLSITS
uniref:S-adenosylmethionine decarboxylase family protein n=1 Tax=Trichocoleus desertorum TaxID=1481672 RepID=UPI0025B4CAD6|nr:S-adenosylmethionine decarboxylase [Trichocoleus desertorum]